MREEEYEPGDEETGDHAPKEEEESAERYAEGGSTR